MCNYAENGLFDISKTKLLAFYHHLNSFDLCSILINRTSLKVINSFNKLLSLHFSPDLKWSTYITSIAKSNTDLLYWYKSHIHLRVVFSCLVKFLLAYLIYLIDKVDCAILIHISSATLPSPRNVIHLSLC